MRVTLSGTLDAGEFVSFRRGTTVIVGHFLCHQNRANTTYNLLNDPDTGHPVAFSRAADGPMFPTRCSSCHDVAAGHPGTGSMPAGHFVAAPSGAPTYWCRCPA